MPKPLDLKPFSLTLTSFASGGRDLSLPQQTGHDLGLFESRRLHKAKDKAAVQVQTQLIQDAAAGQAQVNRTWIVNAANVAVSAIATRGAAENQRLMRELTRTSSGTVADLMNDSLKDSLETLYAAQDKQRELQADVDSGKLSPELAQQALMLLNEATNTEINTRRELAHNGVEHTKRLANMVFQVSRLGGADDTDASS